LKKTLLTDPEKKLVPDAFVRFSGVHKFQRWRRLKPGWPDWANFRLLGDSLLWAAFWKLQYIISQMFGLLFCTVPTRYVLILTKRVLDKTFLGDFYKLMVSCCAMVVAQQLGNLSSYLRRHSLN
jgi:hypothetical protein